MHEREARSYVFVKRVVLNDFIAFITIRRKKYK